MRLLGELHQIGTSPVRYHSKLKYFIFDIFHHFSNRLSSNNMKIHLLQFSMKDGLVSNDIMEHCIFLHYLLL